MRRRERAVNAATTSRNDQNIPLSSPLAPYNAGGASMSSSSAPGTPSPFMPPPATPRLPALVPPPAAAPLTIGQRVAFGERALKKLKLSEESLTLVREFLETSHPEEREILWFIHDIKAEEESKSSAIKTAENWVANKNQTNTMRITIASSSAHNLRSNELRDLRAELIRIGQNPNDLTDTSEQTSDSELDTDDTILVPVPAHLAYHTYAPPLSPTDPYWPLFLPLPPSRPPTPPSLPANTGTTLQQVQPRPPSSASTMATQMPARGDRTAPHFDSKKPRELLRYFSDLEFLFNRASVTDNAQKKGHATRFLEVDDQDIWESLPEFTTANKTWDEFKAAVTKLYPGSDKERKFSMNDLDALIGEQGRLGILSRGEYGEFYRQFLLITAHLIAKNRLSSAEQSRAFRRAMISVSLWDAIHRRLQIKKPDVHPDDPYDIADMNEAAEFVLAGTSAAVPAAAATAAHQAPVAPEIKQEPAVSSLVESLNGLIKILATQAQQQSAPRQNNNTYNQPAAGNECNMCGNIHHFIRNCEVVDEYTRLGKCKRDTNGRVTLPSGAFVPSRIAGKYLKDRIDEWHRQNPGQLAAAQLLLGLAPQPIAVPAPTPAAPAFVLSESDRIQSLERELLALRTRAQARAAAAAGEPVEKPEQPIRAQPAQPAPPAPAPVPANPPANHPAVDQPSVPRILTRPAAAPVPQQPEHPFAQARDAAYAPPRDRNLGARIPNPPAATKKPEVAYRTTAPIYDEKIASEVFGRSMDAPVTLTQRELLSLSPEVRAQVRDATTSRRVASGAKEKATDAAPVPQFFNGEFPAADVEIFDTLEQQREKDARTTAFFDAMPATYTQTAQRELPPNAFIVPDPYEAYYSEGQSPKELVVALESSAIRSILPIIDNQQQVECIIDGGSQIIAMSDTVCHDLGLPYDPRIVLQMQSANGSVNASLGLARNVPFRIGDITLYLQVHVVHNPPYDVLLGRPFDVLTESVVRNYSDEKQTITICDPNTGQVATVPTVPRGTPRSRSQGFPTSRI
uniref:DUF4100 domain-containing protein n=1 Tax=Mycena chlorophos TaxID=658473 RepID=A0ABQ0L498_MYCCL|nr:predicted protein [Mycena chlorophos]